MVVVVLQTIPRPEKVLPSRIMSSITDLGRERTYYIKKYGEVNKSAKIVDLSKINMTVDGIKEKLTQQLILYTSTTAKDFDKITPPQQRTLIKSRLLRPDYGSYATT